MNLIVVAERSFDDRGRISLEGRQATHVREVLRPAVGDSLRVGIVRGRRGTARVLALDGPEILLEPDWNQPPSPRPTIDLVLAMPRPKALARVLATAACMGVGRIDLVNAWRVDKSYLDSPQLQPERLRHNLLLGCEQGATTWLPDIAVHRRLMPLMRGPLAERAGTGQVCCLLAHPSAQTTLEQALPPGTTQPTIAAIGPEGGWIDRECVSFAELGFAGISLGQAVLRVEIAVASLLAQLTLLRRLR